MKDAPISTTGTILEKREDNMTFLVKLPNGKVVLGHLQKKNADLRDSLQPNETVQLEMTPFDFEKARIVARVEA
ncbi:translation initiation factor IF-1 [Rubritalea squalenifaciens DSM 18772]|uniref:Translation initiation factor IF-1 n=2 Tax=Rubritalea TaxID=361050 RepID=A0A1M6RS01_9BACT|nr:translation initiation factor IF-1 [Rubritalea squalenifaciens]SHK35154.1 translation initiation factor IF-1 [Rubritalea squalenifaciens DSM 18772]